MKKILWLAAMFFAFTGSAFAAVNLNTATRQELEAVKGIGPVKAQEIIDYRTQNGPFATVSDLKNVKGFSNKNVARMRSQLSVSGASSSSVTKLATKVAKPAKADERANRKEAKQAGKK